MLSYNKQLKASSQHLRRNMTDVENMLWVRLRRKQLKGHQFYCPKANLVIELDGGQHYSESGKAKDKMRDEVLSKMRIKVLRYSDRDVFENIGGVMEEIWSCL